jgi:hypothetical protein
MDAPLALAMPCFKRHDSVSGRIGERECALARKFLYFIAAMVFLVLSGAFVLRIWGEDLAETAFVPSTDFIEQAKLDANIYDQTAMWFARPEITRNNPTLWLPEGFEGTASDRAAIFFIHPTSFMQRERWNAPLDDEESQSRARIFLRGQASVFNGVGKVWAPRYRQATLGAFLTEKPEGPKALNAAYQDVLQAFDTFIAAIPAGKPIILAGHSQGALHLTQLLQDRIAGTPLQSRVVAAYIIGWPVSVVTDVPKMGLPACETAEQARCLISWQSFAEPADYSRIIGVYDSTTGFNGESRKDTRILCTNPITGTLDGVAKAEENLGTSVPNAELSNATLVEKAVPARCDDRGMLLIGDPPDMGPFVLPGNNYHVYDFNLFWMNIRADVERRLTAFLAK